MAKYLRAVLLCSILIFTFIRILNLGYSDFQGDEVSAQNFLFGEERLLPFIFSRTVGPAQYIIAYIFNLLAEYFVVTPEFIVRLPFTLAGILSVILIFYGTKKFYSEDAALTAALFFSLSGLFIAFSRIVQYQSFIILLSLVTFFSLLWYIRYPSRAKLILLGLASGIGLLFHYDSLSVILPTLLVIILNETNIKNRLKNMVYYALPFLTTVGLFYVPFFLQPNFKSTLSYLINERIRSEFDYDAVFYSIKLMGIYHSKEYLSLVLLFLVLVFLYLYKTYTTTSSRMLLIALVVTIVVRAYSEIASTALICGSVFAGLLYLVYITREQVLKRDISVEFILVLWFLMTFITYGLLFQKPLTHIYNFLLPLFILFGLVLAKLPQFKKNIIYALFIIVSIATISFNYQAFLDTTPEYPWNKKVYLFGEMPSELAENKVVLGVFGFPYNRNWAEIGDKLHALGISKYKSNEKYRLSKYYVQGIAWDDFEFEAFVWIDRPQSFDRQPRPTQDVLAEEENYVIYKYEHPLLYDTKE